MAARDIFFFSNLCCPDSVAIPCFRLLFMSVLTWINLFLIAFFDLVVWEEQQPLGVLL